MSTPTIEEVERAVRAVLGTLAEPPRVQPESEPGPTPTAPPGSTPQAAQRVPGRLLAERHIASLEDSVRLLSVEPGTVVTPLARDLLKRRGIQLQWDRATHTLAQGGEWALSTDHESGLSLALTRSLQAAPDAWSILPESSCRAWLGAGPARGLALLTERSALVVWEAARIDGLRPASCHDVESLQRAVLQIGVNLLAIEPFGQTLSSLRNLLRAYRAAGPPRVPHVPARVSPTEIAHAYR